jgi:predicted glycosyltransferase
MERALIDVLLYAHDGRGLGHISRTVAIGLALRRLFPELRVAVVTGSTHAEFLKCGVALEIIKLPSYSVCVSDGRSLECQSALNLAPVTLTRLRSALLRDLVEATRPRCILVDHIPDGKNGELASSQGGRRCSSIWVLGLRAIPGTPNEIWGTKSLEALEQHYSEVMWYGDSTILNTPSLFTLPPFRGLRMTEIGYVSRAWELERHGILFRPKQKSGCTVALSWQAENESDLLDHIQEAIRRIPLLRPARIFVGARHGGSGPHEGANAQSAVLRGRDYLLALARSRVFLTFGGYNSLTDAMWSRTRTVVLCRDMADQEQRLHVDALRRFTDNLYWPIRIHAANHRLLCEQFATALASRPSFGNVSIDGSEVAALRLASLCKKGRKTIS